MFSKRASFIFVFFLRHVDMTREAVRFEIIDGRIDKMLWLHLMVSKMLQRLWMSSVKEKVINNPCGM